MQQKLLKPLNSPKITDFSRHPDRLGLIWSDGSYDEFHYIWLRNNCPTARHPIVGESILDPLSIPLDIAPQAVQITQEGALHIVWANDQHESYYDPIWLSQSTYKPEDRQARRFSPTFWQSERFLDSVPEISYESIMANDENLLKWLHLLREYGFTIVREVPLENWKVADLAQRIAFLRDSNFGKLFTVESRPDPNSLAYTADKLTAHTDLVSREAQPGLQFLHCFVFDAEGGENILVDGFAAAEELRSRNPEDYELLTTLPVRYRYQDKHTDITYKSPMIRLDTEGAYFEIRYSTALLAPLDIDPDLVKPFYKAYQNFSRILRSPQFEYQFKLQPGDCEVFDNRRVLHGRAAFHPQSGPRYFEGCYVDTDDFLSRLRVLERQGKDFRESLSIVRMPIEELAINSQSSNARYFEVSTRSSRS